jgi:hypothetical protein
VYLCSQALTRITHPNGCKYDGLWFDDFYHGLGKFYFGQRCWYDGQWHRGKVNGEGTFFFHDGGAFFSAHWLDDFFIEKGSCTRKYPDGSICHLKYTDYDRNGRKRRKWEDGMQYDNNWRAELAKLVLAKPLLQKGPAVDQCSSAKMMNFRGKLIVVPDEVQVCPNRKI